MSPAHQIFESTGDSLWYKDAIIYQTHVRAFSDANGDGIGDFQGLTQKLDYLEHLGVTAIWLLPFYPSPLKDDGYDIADYTSIHPSYGTMQDFNRFLREAHKRGLRVITELVINHTSDRHPWFQRARRAKKGSRERNYYVWSDNLDKYKGTRIIFKDFEPSNWSPDPLSGQYYWHRFYSHQPDLNFDSPDVRKTILGLLDFWLRRGVDGLRLDAIPYLYEREGTSCENLPETHAFLKELRGHVDRNFENRMLLAEANQWPEDAVAYFGQGDECHMAFHFPIMPRLFMAIRMENRFPIIDILNETPAIPENSQWAMFLRNHDELTLEMVTDRERDYMYQVYAQDQEQRINLGIRRRLAPLLGNERRAIELMNSLLFSLPGTPVIYYGDEIGMGDNVYLGDRNGVRTPMQWSPDRNAGFSRANSQRLFLPVVTDPEYHYEAVNVENQQNNSRSLLWWMKHAIRLRRQYKAFGRGSLTFLKPDNPKILAFTREYKDERLLIVANLSRFAQSTEIDLSRHVGSSLLECFGQNRFPQVSETPYPMTLAPYAFYWFSLEPQRLEINTPAPGAETSLPVLTTRRTWENILQENGKGLKHLLPAYLQSRRWFGGKGKKFSTVHILDDIRIAWNEEHAHILLVQVEYDDGLRETYSLPLAFAAGPKASEIHQAYPLAVLAALKVGEAEGLLYDALWNEGFRWELFRAALQRRRFRSAKGTLFASTTSALEPLLPVDDSVSSRVMQAEQSNTSVVYGDTFILKIFRRIESGLNTDLEVGRFLTEKTSFRNSPPVVGALEYRASRQEPATIAIIHRFMENQGDAWGYTLDYLDRYFERAIAKASETQEVLVVPGGLFDFLHEEPPLLAKELLGIYLQQVRLLGQRTGELHLALASDSTEPAFAPEPFTNFYQQSQYQSMRSLLTQVFRSLRVRTADVPEKFQSGLQRILNLEQNIIKRFRPIRDHRLKSLRIRTHGDYHLGQVLYTGKDFMIMDFEGEPARSLSERRGKTSAIRDVAGMIRSFHYVSYASMFEQEESGAPLEVQDMQAWRAYWYKWVSICFLQGYFQVCQDSPLLPQDPDELEILWDAYLLEKSMYELGYELNNRPGWVGIPIEGILEIMKTEEGETSKD
ncbi:MAG: maltose alpha-D-glucosyltransferase [Desulfohalobiaceae bacterium]|nr:maltose alpha-D-glucosyltransferase [Desulfohalobiaceae bacterium]